MPTIINQAYFKQEDVEFSIPPLQETIIDVEMTNIQKSIYRALYDKNKTILQAGFSGTGSSINFTTSLNNLEIQLRKCCNHPFLIKDIDIDLTRECITQEDRINRMIQTSGKLLLLDKLLMKMKKEGKKVLIFSQFVHMLVLLEEYLKFRQFRYEKIDGSVKSKDRQLSIDRFNNPEKKRDVFILSTKAGGLGINLTSASVVIIFDSDWNPQNDVQATARAHRIGQQQEVMVYRLITAKTYESEMFERATRKLGLDQAIFMGGQFQDTGKTNGQAVSSQENLNIGNKKISKQEMEILLKKGILGLIENGENQEASKAFEEEDIEQILEKNTRIAKYSLIGGTYSFSKGSFVSKNSDTSMDVNDPNFWQQVLKTQESNTVILINQLRGYKLKSINEQLQFMVKTCDQVSKIVETKLNIVGYSADEEKNMMELLNLIYNSKQFHKFYRDIAIQWTYEIEKPSRRFKKYTTKDLEISDLMQQRSKQDGRKLKSPELSEKEDIFNEGADNFDYDDINDLNLDEVIPKGKLSFKEREQFLRKLCSYCERNRCIMQCEGPCRRVFHEQCKNLVEDGSIGGLDDIELNFQLPEHNMDEETLKKMIKEKFKCQDCQHKIGVCFDCKKKGEMGNIQNGVIKCTSGSCHKFYHLECLKKNHKDTQFLDKNKTKFRCPHHACNKCRITGESMVLSQCLRCPLAFHTKCLQKEHTIKMSKKYIICQNHKIQEASGQIEQDDKKIKKKIRQNTDNIIKLDIKLDEDDFDDVKIQKRNSGRIQRKNIPQFKKPAINLSNLKKSVTKVKLTYEELNIQKPEDFNYEECLNDWCRYCGARYSSNFTKGPWAPRTLCTIHYIDWNQKKKLDLSQYLECPKRPINLDENTEINYLSNLKIKNPDYNFSLILFEPPRIKKVKQDINTDDNIKQEIQNVNEQNSNKEQQNNEPNYQIEEETQVQQEIN